MSFIRNVPKGRIMLSGVLVRLVAKPGKGDDLANFVQSALPIVNSEPGTVLWIAYRAEDTVWIVDASPSEAALQAHLDGDVPKALAARSEELLAQAPEFIFTSVLATKPPLL
jgi:quinol monooxygenase YgiN